MGDVRTQDLQMLMDDIEREELSKEKNEMCGLGARRKTRVGTGEVKSTAKKADKRDVDSLVAFIQGDMSKSDRKNGIKNATTKPIKRVKKNTSKTSTASESGFTERSRSNSYGDVESFDGITVPDRIELETRNIKLEPKITPTIVHTQEGLSQAMFNVIDQDSSRNQREVVKPMIAKGQLDGEDIETEQENYTPGMSEVDIKAVINNKLHNNGTSDQYLKKMSQRIEMEFEAKKDQYEKYKKERQHLEHE